MLPHPKERNSHSQQCPSGKPWHHGRVSPAALRSQTNQPACQISSRLLLQAWLGSHARSDEVLECGLPSPGRFTGSLVPCLDYSCTRAWAPAASVSCAPPGRSHQVQSCKPRASSSRLPSSEQYLRRVLGAERRRAVRHHNSRQPASRRRGHHVTLRSAVRDEAHIA